MSEKAPYLINKSRKSKTLKPLFACFGKHLIYYYRADQKLQEVTSKLWYFFLSSLVMMLLVFFSQYIFIQCDFSHFQMENDS